MAASAAAAIGSSFSSSFNTLKCLRSSTNFSLEPLLKVSSTRSLASLSQSQSQSPLVDTLSVGTNLHKLCVPRVSAQEEIAVADEVEEKQEEGEDFGEGEQVVEGGEAAGESVNTKLYFGNLPYSVDSAQLAGIIQEYGSPELIEVSILILFSIQ